MAIMDFLTGLASGKQEKELRQFITRVKGLDDDEVGAIVAYATAARGMWDHILSQEKGRSLSLRDPFEVVREVGDINFRLHRIIKTLQQNGKYVESSGIMIWLHTVRAAENPDIRFLCKEMWGELMRGFPHVMDYYSELSSICDFPVYLEGYNEFPIGMEPRNAEHAYKSLLGDKGVRDTYQSPSPQQPQQITRPAPPQPRKCPHCGEKNNGPTATSCCSCFKNLVQHASSAARAASTEKIDCWRCGKTIKEADPDCPHCGYPQY